MTTDKDKRKESPMYRGLLKYFPDALAYVAHVSYVGNVQHNGPESELRWTREKSTDHGDCIIRHQTEAGTVDTGDNLLHSGKVAWRALAQLQLELEARGEAVGTTPTIESLPNSPYCGANPTESTVIALPYPRMTESGTRPTNPPGSGG